MTLNLKWYFLSIFIWRKKGNVLFNDVLNTFYLQLYGIKHMVKDYLDCKKGNPLPPLHGLLIPVSSKWSFMCTISQTGQHITQSVMVHWLNRKIAKWVNNEGSIRWSITRRTAAVPQSYISLGVWRQSCTCFTGAHGRLKLICPCQSTVLLD